MIEENKIKFESYMNEQLKILKDHMERIMLRIHNKYMQLNIEQEVKQNDI